MERKRQQQSPQSLSPPPLTTITRERHEEEDEEEEDDAPLSLQEVLRGNDENGEGKRRRVRVKPPQVTSRAGRPRCPSTVGRSDDSKAAPEKKLLLSNLFPPDGNLPRLFDSNFLLEALKEEGGLINPEIVLNRSLAAADTLKRNGALAKYIVSFEEAAVLCAIPILLKAGFDFEAMFESAKTRPPSKFLLTVLTSLRKLPQYSGKMYFGTATEKRIKKTPGDFQMIFLVAHTLMSDVQKNLNGVEDSRYKEISIVGQGWGYNLTDFVIAEAAVAGKGNVNDGNKKLIR